MEVGRNIDEIQKDCHSTDDDAKKIVYVCICIYYDFGLISNTLNTKIMLIYRVGKKNATLMILDNSAHIFF